eukprot:7955265-Heterocapsa_arctica.AAC.1
MHLAAQDGVDSVYLDQCTAGAYDAHGGPPAGPAARGGGTSRRRALLSCARALPRLAGREGGGRL